MNSFSVLPARKSPICTCAWIKQDFETAPVSEKMKALLAIAALVQQNGKNVTPAVVDRAREAGATDREIQDTVLIAALFCLYNKYVDGLASVTPADTVLIAGLFCLFNRYLDGLGVESADPPEALREWGKALAEHGYAG